MLCPCCFSTYSLHKKWLSSNPSKKQERVKINNISCNSLLSAFEKGRCWMDALHLFEKMRRWRLHTQVSKGAFHFGYHFKRNSNPPPVIAVDSTTLFAVDCLSIIHPSSPPSSYDTGWLKNVPRRCKMMEVSFNAVASACEKSWQWRRALLYQGVPDVVACNVYRGCQGLLRWWVCTSVASNKKYKNSSGRPRSINACEKLGWTFRCHHRCMCGSNRYLSGLSVEHSEERPRLATVPIFALQCQAHFGRLVSSHEAS